MKALTVQKIEHMLWLAHRISRAKAKAARSGFADETLHLEQSLIEEMRPHLIMTLRLAARALRGMHR